uniref:Uncharacterized protein n=1 Tax=Janibacter limosus TaxID=53458 RepID=A0AC61U321_9MICO|nr:hypothetical protein [Janibacter limosus]
MDLQQGAETAHRHRALLAEGEQPQDLVAGEGQRVRTQGRLDALVEKLLRAHDGCHERHAVGSVGPAVRDPLGMSCGNGVAVGHEEIVGRPRNGVGPL